MADVRGSEGGRPGDRRGGAGRVDRAQEGPQQGRGRRQGRIAGRARSRDEPSGEGDRLPVDIELSRARPDQFDALVLPGGVINPDKLRVNPEAVAFVRAFVDAGKPVGAICHGPWTLIDAGIATAKHMTAWPAEERPDECRRRMDRRERRDGHAPGDQPQAGRPAGLQRKDGRAVRKPGEQAGGVNSVSETRPTHRQAAFPFPAVFRYC